MVSKFGRFNPQRRVFPRARITTASQFDSLIDLGVLDGFEPAAPFIAKNVPIVTMGSCFAQNVAKNLGAAGYTVFTLPVMDRLFTPVALSTFIERALRDGAPVEDLRTDWRLEQGQIDTMRHLVKSGSPVIVTFGMSTIWVEKATDQYVLDPSVKFVADGQAQRVLPNADLFEMRQMRMEEITDHIVGIINALRAMNFQNKIVLTLSPIPLVYSGSDYPVVAADCISKSGLRFAIDEVMRLNIKDVYYFPSFEILRWLAPMADKIWFEDKRVDHIRNEWIAYTVGKFRQFYCAESVDAPVPPLSSGA